MSPVRDGNFQEHVEESWSHLQRFTSKMRDRGVSRCMLSGGLDSRLLAGCMTQSAGGPSSALTFGIDTDLEVRIARRVADRAGMSHATQLTQLGHLPQWLEPELLSGGASGGLYSLQFHSLTETDAFWHQPLFTVFWAMRSWVHRMLAGVTTTYTGTTVLRNCSHP
jgi:hypothetical protein